jgi:hypothetical protein
VLEAMRRDLAERYLADPDLSISKIAWLLGYQESSALSRAYKRWTAARRAKRAPGLGLPRSPQCWRGIRRIDPRAEA